MKRGERPFSKTIYAHMHKESVIAARMLARGYCQVSRRFGHVSRVDVSDTALLRRVGEVCGTVSRPVESWYDFYRRCLSEDVITGVPEPIMFMIRNPGEVFVHRPPRPSDEEFVEMIIELGLV